MIGLPFKDFLAILIVGLIAAVIIQFAIRYRVLGTVDGFFAKWTAGWVGGWLGSPVLGHWGWRVGEVYVIPALIGAFMLAFAVTAVIKAEARVLPSLARPA